MVHRTGHQTPQSGRQAAQSGPLSSGSYSRASSRSGSSLCPIETSLRQHEQLHGKGNLSQQVGPVRCFLRALSRKKPLDCRTETSLNRCLNLLDLTSLGVGSTLGLGLYVLAGQVASNKAGPGVVISFALAALASAFSALCYAEFAGRVPRAGSAYAYSYITVGEFVAFIIGWNLILEYVIGASSVARGFSGYICFVYNHVSQSLGFASQQQQQQQQQILQQQPIQNHHPGPLATSLELAYLQPRLTIYPNDTTSSNLTTATTTTGGLANTASNLIAATLSSSANQSASSAATLLLAESTGHSFWSSVADYLVEYFDWPSVAIIGVATIFILFGVRESTNISMAFTVLNLMVVVAVVISSLSSLDIHNWRLSKSEIPIGYGDGGFLPYGWSGVLAGSATCFFGFIGFDTIASSAEEAKNPKRNVPLSILLSLFISFIAYMAVAIVQTLIWPYYDQNKVTILPYIFNRLDMPIAYWVVLLGAVAGLTSSTLGGMYPLPRILYSMANDRLIYGYLAIVNQRLKLPVRATIVGSIFVAILSCLLDIQDLADMVSIGTLAAYSLVSLSVLILRYEDRRDAVDDSTVIGKNLSFTDILSHLSSDDAADVNQRATGAAGEPVSCTDETLKDDHLVNPLKVAANFNHHHMKQIMAQNTQDDISMDNITNQDKKDKKKAIALDLAEEEDEEQQRVKLANRTSTLIREKGSKPVEARLSVGFQSWFKSDDNNKHDGLSKGGASGGGGGSNPEDSGCGGSAAAAAAAVAGQDNLKRLSYLGLLLQGTNKMVDPEGQRAKIKRELPSPNDQTSRQSKILIGFLVVLSILLDFVALWLMNVESAPHHPVHTHHKQPAHIIGPSGSLRWHQFMDSKTILACLCCLLLALIGITMLMLSRLPVSKSMSSDMFQVPLVPLVPTLSILVNTFLMLNLSYLTWVRFAVWMAIGLFIYFTYGIWKSRGYLLHLTDVATTKTNITK